MTGFATSATGDIDDASLARAAAAGDRIAFAEIYDRYADKLHDFCVGILRDREAAADCVQDVFVTAATKLAQLREPDKLRSWLYAIARSEALAQIRARKREQLSEEIPEMPSGQTDLATMAARSELADLIKEASGGLSDRDQVVLELAYRQDLDGSELADALGVTARNANTLVERLRETIARSLGALLLCRRTKADPQRCPELAAILDQWDGTFTVLMRKRVARHIDGCAICEDDRARMVSPAALLGASPLVIPAPAWLRQRTLDRALPNLPHAGSAPAPGGSDSCWPPADFDVVEPARAATAWRGQAASPPRPRCSRCRAGPAGHRRRGNAHRAGRPPRRPRQFAGIHDPVHHDHECEHNPVGPRAHRAQSDAAAGAARPDHDDRDHDRDGHPADHSDDHAADHQFRTAAGHGTGTATDDHSAVDHSATRHDSADTYEPEPAAEPRTTQPVPQHRTADLTEPKAQADLHLHGAQGTAGSAESELPAPGPAVQWWRPHHRLTGSVQTGPLNSASPASRKPVSSSV